MGFDAIAQPASAGPVVKAGIDACLTHARSNASAGDVYQDDTSKACFVYDASGSGILVPAEWAGNTLTLVPNASGTCYITLADEESDVGGNPIAGRGWLIVDSGGTVTKTATNPLVMHSASAGHYCYMTYTPSTAPTTGKKYLMIAKIASTAAAGTNWQNLWMCGPAGGKIRALCPDAGAVAGDYSWAEAGSVLEGAASMSLGTGAAWISVYYGPTGEVPLATNMTAPEDHAAVLYSDLVATYSTYQNCLYLGSYTSGAACTLNIYELFLFEVT